MFITPINYSRLVALHYETRMTGVHDTCSQMFNVLYSELRERLYNLSELCVVYTELTSALKVSV